MTLLVLPPSAHRDLVASHLAATKHARQRLALRHLSKNEMREIAEYATAALEHLLTQLAEER